MQILKSLGDGIGTAAGVAWPTFGIVFGTLGLSIGGSGVIILGSISTALFFLVLIPITYWSYRTHVKEKKELRQSVQQQADKLNELIFNYLLVSFRECLFDNEKKNVKNVNDIDHAILIHQFKTKILSDSTFTNVMHRTSFATKPPSYSLLIKAGIIGFSAAFGSIAGCAAGTLGMLGAVGLFAGITTVPMIGWAIIAAAVLFGLAVTGVCVYSTYKKNITCQLISHYKTMNSELKNMTLIKNIKIDAEIKAKKRYEKEIEKNNLISNTKQKNLSADLKYSNPGKSIWHDASQNQTQGINVLSNFPETENTFKIG